MTFPENSHVHPVNLKELQEKGLLWAINRYCLHPRGLALAVDPNSRDDIRIIVSTDGIFAFSLEEDDAGVASFEHYVDTLREEAAWATSAARSEELEKKYRKILDAVKEGLRIDKGQVSTLGELVDRFSHRPYYNPEGFSETVIREAIDYAVSLGELRLGFDEDDDDLNTVTLAEPG